MSVSQPLSVIESVSDCQQGGYECQHSVSAGQCQIVRVGVSCQSVSRVGTSETCVSLVVDSPNLPTGLS